VKAIADRVGVAKTLLGVDVVLDSRLIASDVDEGKLLELIQNRPTKLVVTPIGGQGYIFGRGNQQISPKIITKVGKENIIVVATRGKLEGLPQKRLLVDTGDRAVDTMLRGYVRVITDYREETVIRVE
jgi:predicted polyphosphate/ATP-dependent NAD kinase